MDGNFRSRHTVLRGVPEPRARVGYEEEGPVEGDPALYSANGRELDRREGLWRGLLGLELEGSIRTYHDEGVIKSREKLILIVIF